MTKLERNCKPQKRPRESQDEYTQSITHRNHTEEIVLRNSNAYYAAQNFQELADMLEKSA